MIVLFFTRRFYPLIGGVEKHVLEIGKRLVKKGYKVIVITEYKKNTNGSSYQSLPVSATIEGIEILRIQTGEEGRMKKFRIWLSLLKYIRIIKAADIIHCHDIFFWYLPFRFLFPFKKVYTTFHGYEGNNIPSKKSILMHKIAEKLSLGNICVGDYLKKWYGTNYTIVTYGAIDLEFSKKFSENMQKNKIIFVGRLEEETGIKEYLRVIKLLRDNNYIYELDIYGEGSLNNYVVLYSKDNKLKINLKGVITNTESVLKNYEYVFCSRYLGILESMAAKKLVFVEYNNKIKKDCFQLAPFKDYIFLSDNAKDMTRDFIEVVKNPKLSIDKINKAYEWVSKQTWDKMVSQYLDLWKI